MAGLQPFEFEDSYSEASYRNLEAVVEFPGDLCKSYVE